MMDFFSERAIYFCNNQSVVLQKFKKFQWMVNCAKMTRFDNKKVREYKTILIKMIEWLKSC